MRNTRPASLKNDAHGLATVLRRLTGRVSIVYACPLTIFMFFNWDAANTPRFNLDSWFALCAYVITETGGTKGAPLVGIVMLGLLVSRAGIALKQRLTEALVVFVFLLLLNGGGSALNEYVIKPVFKSPRPHIVYLAGDNGSGPLQMPADEFYALAKEERQRLLRAVLEAEPPPLMLPRLIKEHWIATIGYSFPSGHAFASMFFASFFLAMGLTLASRLRRICFFLLLPWAVCVAFSRVVLWVHTIKDIIVGSFIGLLFGWLAFILVRMSLRAIARKASLSTNG
ncbi:hypothetical protein DCC62_08400 [candidate division KSB1 bacterium]|nr:MAG: hypothetical protein DCC62_08400 [candidate division KSB1 bacterium]